MIKVGIIGANPDRGWAVRAHVPALAALEEYALTAVATSRIETARAAALQFGVEHAFTDPGQLAAHPDVDLVVITVKVPQHVELVRHALDAGKHVYCEWPLAVTTEQAADLAARAAAAGVFAVTGLQTRYAPAVAYARELVAAGHLGRVTGAVLRTSRAKGGRGSVPAWSAYTLDRSNGAGPLEVMGGHALDALQHVIDEFVELTSTLAVQHPRMTVEETGEQVEVTSPDHIAVQGTLAGGVVASVQIRDADAGEPGTRLEIAGTEGTLTVLSLGGDSWADVQFSVGDLGLYSTTAGGAPRRLEIPERHRVRPSIEIVGARNVSRVYEQLHADIQTGRQSTPSFADGVRLHRLLDAVRRSADTGTRQTLW